MLQSTRALKELLNGLGARIPALEKNSMKTAKSNSKVKEITKEEPIIYSVSKGSAKFIVKVEGFGELAMSLSEKDAFKLLGNEDRTIDEVIYKKVEVIEAKYPKLIGKTGWIDVSRTNINESKEIYESTLLTVEFDELTIYQDTVIGDCKNIKAVGILIKGDVICYNDVRDTKTLGNQILKQVIIKKCDTPELVGETVWMPVIYIGAKSSKDIDYLIFKIRKETEFSLSSNLDIKYNLSKGDKFILTRTLPKFDTDKGVFYKEIKIVSSNNQMLVEKTGWVSIVDTNAFTCTTDFLKVDRKSSIRCKKYILPMDAIGYTPNYKSLSMDNMILINKGTPLTIFDETDNNGNIIVRFEKDKGCGAIEYIDCAISPTVYVE